MRGNERLESYRLGAAGYRFQIPMRGNEFRVGRRAGRVPGAFQIPMRGNETVQQGEALMQDDMVSNPHEG